MKQIYTTCAAMFLMGMAATQTNAQTVSDNVLFYESFNALAGNGGNDGYFDNSEDPVVEVGAEDLLDATLLDNKEGWGEFVKVAICNQCVRIATKKNSGSITTPAFAVDGGVATLTFNAAAQLEDIVTLYVELTGQGNLTYGDVTGQKISIELPASEAGVTKLADQNYTVALSDVTGDVTLTFSTVSSSTDKQRAYLDEIKVTSSNSTSLSQRVVTAEDAKAYTIDGKPVVGELRKGGIYIVGGRKVVK